MTWTPPQPQPPRHAEPQPGRAWARWRRPGRRAGRRRTALGAIGLGVFLTAAGAGAQTLMTDVTDPALAPMTYGARGTTFGDCDNDGVLELFATPSGSAPAARLSLFGLGADGRFREHQGAIPLPGGLVNWQTWPGGGPLFADYDNDGDLDLFVPLGLFLGELSSRNLLFRNDGGALREVGQAAGLTDVLPTDNAIWLDYDRDGFLDLYTGNLSAGSSAASPVRNRLSRNRGDGTFEDATAAAGLDLPMNPAAGGSNGGMVAADFDGDGWTDLYVGVYEAPNRLFLNDGAGHFRDATTPAIGDDSMAFGVAVGDYDNDGDLDLFQAGGGGGGNNRSPLLRNAGDGTFEDVLEAAGLAALATGDRLEADFVDLDNDGDLDLITGKMGPPSLFLNQGDGTFVDATSQLGFEPPYPFRTGMSAADYDRDGAVDLVVAGHLLRNNGNGNHWLHVELVGTASNRSGIGARVQATAGDLVQLREILGGRGYSQDELAAHFGLGGRTTVDRLQVRWPSGRVDLVEGVPADQRIRLIEGQPGYQPVQPFRVAIAVADTVLSGWEVAVSATVWPAPFDASARVVGVAADLSALGGPAVAPLAAQADGSYHLAPTGVRVGGAPGWRDVVVRVEQSTAAGPHWTALGRTVLVAPPDDLVLFGDAPAVGWGEPTAGSRTQVDLRQTAVVAEGTTALAVSAERSLSLSLAADEPLPTAGYRALRFLFHPGDATLANTGSLTLTLVSYTLTSGGTAYDQKYTAVLMGRSGLPGITLDMAAKQWQEIVVPLESFTYMQAGGVSLVQSLTIVGAIDGTVYLDDLRLLSAGTGLAPPPTAVVEARGDGLPEAFRLAQNYPNPFNGGTVIAYDLPAAGPVQLAVYNMAGQRVVNLVRGERAAGSYRLAWDGRDDDGRALASGVYVYVLRAGGQETVRRLLLVR